MQLPANLLLCLSRRQPVSLRWRQALLPRTALPSFGSSLQPADDYGAVAEFVGRLDRQGAELLLRPGRERLAVAALHEVALHFDRRRHLAAALLLPGAGEKPGIQHVDDLAALARLDLARGRPEACARAAVEALKREIARPTLEIAETKAILGECLLALERPAIKPLVGRQTSQWNLLSHLSADKRVNGTH